MILKVNEDSLASVLFLDKKLEEYPEPYRGHGDLTLSVSFTQYISFIRKYLEVTDYLATPTSVLKARLVKREEELLRKSFYKDMACAVMKELWFTSIDGEPTKIIHFIEDAPGYNLEYVEAIICAFKSEMGVAQNDLVSFMESKGYVYSAGVLKKNSEVVDYASLLYAMSSNTYGIGFASWSYMEG